MLQRYVNSFVFDEDRSYTDLVLIPFLSQDGVIEENSEDPDVYDIDIIAWDYGLSPLHLAILNGHVDIIQLLVSEYGADVLLPVKLVEPAYQDKKGAIMTIVLAMSLPTEQAKKIVKLLLELGATSAQADMNHFTVFHYVVGQDEDDLLDVLLARDRPAALGVLNNVGFQGSWGSLMGKFNPFVRMKYSS